jgi:hypothetical protein
MTDHDHVLTAAHGIAEAIGRRDVAALERRLAPGFLHRTPGCEPQEADAFLGAIARIPGDLLFVRLERVAIDLVDAGAVVTGIQHAQVRIDGEVIDDRRPFVDWFVKQDGEWRIRLAVEPSAPPE